MSHKYEIVKLGDLGTVVGGATPSTKDPGNWNGDIPWLSPKDLTDYKDRYISKGERNITQKGYDSCSTKMLPKNSILFSSRAPIGYIAIANCDLCTNQGFKSIIPNENTDPLYLYYLLKYNKDNIANKGSGTTFSEVSGKVMQECEVNAISDLDTQKRVANILDSFDKKIELNTRINSHLEDLIMSVNKQFLQGSNLSECVASDVFDIFIGKTPPRKESDWFSFNKAGNVVWISIKDMGTSDAYLYDSSEYLTSEAVEKFNIKNALPGSILLSFKLTIGRVKIVTFPMTTNEAIACFSSEDARKLAWIYPILKTYNYERLGSTSSIAKAVNSKIIKAMPLLMPTDDILDEYYKRVKSLYELLKNNTKENIALTELRDTILPKLMSGKIEIQ